MTTGEMTRVTRAATVHSEGTRKLARPFWASAILGLGVGLTAIWIAFLGHAVVKLMAI